MAQAVKKQKTSKIIENEKYKGLVTQYKYIMIVNSKNAKSRLIHDLRSILKSDSLVLFGKRKIIIKSLESTKITNISEFAQKFGQSSFLIFTNRDIKSLTTLLKEIGIKGFLKEGEICDKNVVIPRGIVKINDTPVPVDLEKTLRALDFSCVIKDGKVVLENDFVVTEKGKPVNGKQCKILKMFGFELAVLKVDIVDVFYLNK